MNTEYSGAQQIAIFALIFLIPIAIFLFKAAKDGKKISIKSANKSSLFEAIIFSFILLFIAFISYAYFSTEKSEREEWEKFKIDHKCKLVSKIDGETSIGTGVATNGSVGIISSSSSGKTVWLCDDGVTYYKNSD